MWRKSSHCVLLVGKQIGTATTEKQYGSFSKIKNRTTIQSMIPLLDRLSAAAAAKSLQSCPTLCDPIDGGPPGSPVPGILQGRTLE